MNNSIKQSTLDHIYVNNLNAVLEFNSFPPPFGDHLPIFIVISSVRPKDKISFRRDWRRYTPTECLAKFNNVNLQIDCVSVQDYWNVLENIIINQVDQLAPITQFKNDVGSNSGPPLFIKNKIIKRKKLMKKQKNCSNTVKLY